ncbi:pirin family protein [Bdellovibrio bacteriovorus]|uniref:pirin family protein n=1 Tax=Bdellovibrio bacteriovorus TaxID=959 RepID=UPI001E53BA19|nr:pirin family protein [Bdellovibrio bacteriovorus]
MKQRSIKQVASAIREDIDDLITRRALPTHQVRIVDPFLFLNHHGPQTYPSPNHGLPFGPHPHRGFETVTFILEGDIAHRDSGGHESVINAGGVQWMTAGDGLIHEEVSSEEFMKKGGPLEILQLWVNLPAKLKRTKPNYRGLQAPDIPKIKTDDGKVTVEVVSGSWLGEKGAFEPLVDIQCQLLHLKASAQLDLTVSAPRNIFFYVVRGSVTVNGQTAERFQLVEFNNDGDTLRVNAEEDAVILFAHADPFNEPVISHGPFVMNTKAEIIEAIEDYQAGKFG